MKNLLKQLLKEDILGILPWLFIPLIGAFAGLYLRSLTGIVGFDMLAFISAGVLFMGPLIALVIIVGNDHNRFYGKYAALYDTYPLSSGKITLARLLNYAILGIFTAFTFLFNMSLVLPSEFDIVDFFRELFRLLGELSPEQYWELFKILLTLIGLGLMLALTFMAANSIGNSYYLKKLGKLGPVLVGVILFALENYIQIKMIASYSVDKVIVDNPNVRLTFFETNYLFVAIFILEIVILYVATNYFHKKTLSVA
ncbi:hypothetical protein [Anaerococcus vaginimassiliensis]|uniref:hypothetical protein n=1 Tax=Anaerococcus vaginimassiliensis TaxID=2042308 RepID=UPI0010316935|nr:hypothetical protein [Anaerococcus vaginimassiliensis]